MSSSRSPSLGRSVLPALALTGAAVGLLSVLDRPSSDVPDAVDASGIETLDATVGPGARAATPSSSPLPSTSTASPATASPATASTSTASTSTASPRPTAAPDAAACTGEAVTGPAVATQWGAVQVVARFAADGSLCDVQAVQYPDDNPKSSSINARALPELRTRALAVGTATFDAVSGATVTSRGYQQSLQAILDGR